MRNFTPAALRGFLVGVVLVLVSLPILFALHGALKLGNPPASGLILLGATVAITLALASGAGALVGESRGNPWVAALVGLGIGLASCAVAAPLYGTLVVDGLQRDATNLVWNERGRITGAAGDAVQAAREGRLRDELARLQEQAKNATTAEGRKNATEQAKSLAAQLTPKGIEILKSGAAKLSAFALLAWALLAPPFGAAWECRRQKR